MEGPTQDNDHSTPTTAAAGTHPRWSKRDEWSDGAVTILLDAYESKWVLRNRAKLKGQDWEDVARTVSNRAGSTKGNKTPVQCKNKVESMKKRYRSESAAAGSRWPLFERLDGMVRCSAPPTGLVEIDRTPVAVSNSPKFNGAAVAEKDECEETRGNLHTNKTQIEERSSMQSDDDSSEGEKKVERKKRRKKGTWESSEVIESIQWFAEVMLKVEQGRIEAIREVEIMKAKAEAMRGEMDLKRTEIIANTQLQIAKLLSRTYG
ncbi:uncharacterized protein [Typha latifolia]|uniref:uncharacterized protein n=1 Tax=Typha latifolia TaxID=4733 RepID=UPI003C2F8C3F